MATVDFTTKSDADFEHTFTIKDDGVPRDLTGSTFRMMVRRKAADVETLFDLTTANGGIVTVGSPADGKIKLTLAVAYLARLAEDIYAHSLIQTRADQKKIEVWAGTMTHKIGPTRG